MDYKDFSADAVHFQLQCVPARLPELLASGTHAKLKLQTKLSIGARHGEGGGYSRVVSR